jgi:hypothetical protein
MSEQTISKMCLDKKRYPTLISVFGAMGRVKVYFHGKETRHYKCPLCGGYHITTRPKNDVEIAAEENAKKMFLKTA